MASVKLKSLPSSYNISITNFPGEEDHLRCKALTQKNIKCTKLKHGTSELCSMHEKSKQQAIFLATNPIDDVNKLNIGYPKFYVAEVSVPAEYANKPPYLDIPWHVARKGSKLIICMINPDNPNVKKNNQYLHWLAINLDEQNDDPEVNTVIGYEKPITRTTKNRYIFYLLCSLKDLDADTLKKLDRNNFNLGNFVKDYDLRVLDVNYFWA